MLDRSYEFFEIIYREESRNERANSSLPRIQNSTEKVDLGIRMPQRILLIEDNDETRELLRMALEKRGYEVTVAEDGVRGYDTALFLKPDQWRASPL